MKILLVVPASKEPGGHVVTGRRWAAIFRTLRHRPTISAKWRPGG